MAGGMEERIMRLVRQSPTPRNAPTSREELLEEFKPCMEAIGLCVGPELDKKLAPRVIHVAGTKGKGSTCAMLERVFRAAGLRTGLFTSPHMVRPHERVRLQGKPVSEELLAHHFEQVYNTLTRETLMPGFFSFLTVLGFHIFAAQELDVVIIEVGLGGRLDATNLLGAPAACAITLLDLDHTEYLGDTIEKIAAEKAGIIKFGSPVVISSGQEPSAVDVIKDVATKVCAGEVVVATPLDKSFCKLGLAGDHQYINAGIVAEITRLVAPDVVTNAVLRQGLEEVKWPGRSQKETLSEDLEVFLDGAHTPKSIACALQWAKDELELPTPDAVRNVLLFSCMHSRDPLLLFAEIKKSGLKFDKVIFTPTLYAKPTYVKMKSAAEILGKEPSTSSLDETGSPEIAKWESVLGEIWSETMRDIGPAFVYNSLQDALDAIKDDVQHEFTGPNEVRTRMLVTGSLLLVGDTMQLWKIPVA